jgi:hypothetical protein
VYSPTRDPTPPRPPIHPMRRRGLRRACWVEGSGAGTLRGSGTLRGIRRMRWGTRSPWPARSACDC